MRRRPPNRPARRFAARTAGVLLVLGLAVHALLVQAVDAELDGQLRLHAEFVGTYLLTPEVVGGTVGEEALAAVVRDDPQVTALVVRDADGTRVASAGTAGPTDVVHRVELADGLAAEVSQDDGIVQAPATDLTRRVTVVLGGGLLLLWLAIVPLAYRLGRELRGQADELRAQADELRATGAELRRLLDREQVTVRRLQEVDELRDRFLESVSHELRTPMAVVKGSLALLRQHGDALPPTTRAELVERADAKAERLDELVLGLLEMNRSLDPATDGELVAVPDLLRDVCTQLPPREVELDLEVSVLETSPTRLGRALGHLVGNAIRHAPDDELVVVRSRIVDGGVELQVDDRGAGIPDALKLAVFDPFRQGELHDAHSPGIGMGLSIVARYAAEHDGRAWVSDRPGGGARVHLLLADVLPDDLPPVATRGPLTPGRDQRRPVGAARRTVRRGQPTGRPD